MEKKLAMRWVRALRSGKFLQGNKKLRRPADDQGNNGGRAEYCCLGVLGEICGIDRKTLNENACLDEGLNKICGIKTDLGVPQENWPIRLRIIGNRFDSFPNLAEANDKGATFRSIATWIEKNYRKL